MKCFYHSSDLDGWTSGAIVKQSFPETEMFPINYGQDFPWHLMVPGETVYVVDFTVEPFDQMLRLDEMCDLVWIDHHATSIDEAKKANFSPKGLRRVGDAACELAWEFLNPNRTTPIAVRLLGRYDVWDHKDPRVLPFQYGLRLVQREPSDLRWWAGLFLTDAMSGSIEQTITIGESVLAYESQSFERYCKSHAFESVLDGWRAVCVNRGLSSSKLFESVWDEEQFDVMVAFSRLAKGKWTVSVYSTKEEVDCGRIAQKFGGGGHKGAAGFVCEKLPFVF